MKYYGLSSLLLVSLLGCADPQTPSDESTKIDCDNASSTLEINACAQQELDAANAQLQAYLTAAYEHHSDDAQLLAAIKTAQQQWQAYADAHCQAIYTQWREGTIRGVMALSCRLALTRQRTHEVWDSFLTYMDSSPPLLPEPSLQ